MAEQKVYKPSETAGLLKISLRTLQRYRDDGLIEFTQLKRKILFSEKDIENFINNYRKPTFINSKNFKYDK